LLSQSETGQLVLHKTDVDLAEMVRDVADQFQIPAEAQGVRLSADAPEHCIIHADRIQIERLLSNLLSNAVKYTPAGGDVHVLVEGGSQQTCLVVEDTGAGIAAEHLPHIYDRFYRVPSADPEKGLGLGLSFVAWIVKAHEGTIEVNSRLGAGTRFEVNLPCGQTAVSEQAGGLVDVRAE
jgi:signal transduction histidine kinase